MNHPLILRSIAEREYDDGVAWYSARSVPRGREFQAAVQAVFDRISANPRLHQVVLRDIRRAVVADFPYVVYYRQVGQNVVVISVFHTSRNPAIWQRRS